MKRIGLQSFSVLCYKFRKWEHFQITKFNRVCLANLALQQLFPIQILLSRFEIWSATKFYISMLHTSNLAVLHIFSLLFSFLVFTKSQVLKFKVGRSHDNKYQLINKYFVRSGFFSASSFLLLLLQVVLHFLASVRSLWSHSRSLDVPSFNW